MLDQTLYYLNHIPLMMTWAYFYNEFLPVRKSYRKDYVILATAILAAVLILIQIYEIPGSEQECGISDDGIGSDDRCCCLFGKRRRSESHGICSFCPAAAFHYR